MRTAAGTWMSVTEPALPPGIRMSPSSLNWLVGCLKVTKVVRT